MAWQRRFRKLSEREFLDALTEENVVVQIRRLETRPAVASRPRRGELQLYGRVYKIHTGEIWTNDVEQQRFVLLDSRMPSAVRGVRRRGA
ncbi:MAG TPA: carbonic anhydrase [Bryobacteraceae bacterium]|nr:carbonic anhydrase [Bryobacteraceae bacterium]